MGAVVALFDSEDVSRGAIVKFPAQSKAKRIKRTRDEIEERTTEPIKNLDDIAKIYKYFYDKRQYRNMALFVTAINLGLRVSDLISLRWEDLYDIDWTPRESCVVEELKTGKLRKFRASKVVYDNLEMYKGTMNRRPDLKECIFQGCNSGGSKTATHMNRRSVVRVFDKAASDLNLGIRIGTHGLRKTFGYQVFTMSGKSDEALMKLQMIFNHSSPQTTLRYIGITKENLDQVHDDIGELYASILQHE